MKLLSLIFFVSVMATTVHASVGATFDCKVISGYRLGIKEGKEQYIKKLDRDYGKSVRISFEMGPDGVGNHLEFRMDYQEDQDVLSYIFPSMRLRNVQVSDWHLAGGSVYGGFRLDADFVTFYSNRATGIHLTRYYRNDFHGVMVTGLTSNQTRSNSSAIWTYGLNCQSSYYNEQNFINFYRTWKK